MKNKNAVIIFTGILGVILTKYILNKIGIENISLELKVIGLVIGPLYFVVLALKEKNVKARKYQLLFSGAIYLCSFIIASMYIIEYNSPELIVIIKKPMRAILPILFLISIIPLRIAKAITNKK